MEFFAVGIWIFMAWYLPRVEAEHPQKTGKPLGKAVVKNLAQVYFQMGALHESLMDHPRAVLNFKDAVRTDPNCAPAYFKLGKNYILANDYQKAIEPLELAIGLNPDETTARIYLGWVNNQLGRHEEAAESLKKALAFSALCPSCGIRHHNFKDSDPSPLPTSSDKQEAGAVVDNSQNFDFQESLPLSFGNTASLEKEQTASFGNAPSKNVSAEDAIIFANAGKQSANLAGQDIISNSKTSSGKGDNPVKEITFDGLSLVDARLAVTFYRYGVSHIKLEEYFPAIMELTEAVQLDPEFSDAHYALGLAYERLGMLKESVSEYIKALKDKPAYHEAKFKLSEEMSLSELKRLLPEHFENSDSPPPKKHLYKTSVSRIPYPLLVSQN